MPQVPHPTARRDAIFGATAPPANPLFMGAACLGARRYARSPDPARAAHRRENPRAEHTMRLARVPGEPLFFIKRSGIALRHYVNERRRLGHIGTAGSHPVANVPEGVG